MDNPLAAQAGPAPSADASAPPIISALGQSHDMAKAIYSHSNESLKRLDSIRVELTKLSNLGDAVTSDDVVGGAGKLVALGLGPTQLAGLLADMPTSSGQAIQTWLQSHLADITKREQTATLANNLSRHEMGVSALRLLAAHGAQAGQAPAGPQPGAAVNPLTATTGSAPLAS